MKHYILGAVAGFLAGTLFGLSAIANMLFVTGVSGTDVSDVYGPAGESNAETFEVEEEVEFDPNAPAIDPASIPPPQDGDEVIKPGD